MAVTQSEIAKALEISDAYLSQIFAGICGPGKPTARKMGEYANRPWTDFFDMTPDQIRDALFEAASKRKAA